MNLAKARRVVRAGQYAYPATWLALAALAWARPLREHAFLTAVAVLMAAGLWLLLRTTTRWLVDAAAEQEDLGKQLIHSQRVLALGEISSGIAHEINNPLNIILQEAELMRADLDDVPNSDSEEMKEIREGIEVILSQVRRCSDITHKLLDFARNRKPVCQYANINRLAEDMLTLVERETVPRNIRVVRRLNARLPEVKTDPPLLRQVFLNLLINAVQAVGRDGEIAISTFVRDGMACTEVRDSGPGVAPEDMARIFHPFFTTKPPGEGTGLGLPVSLRIINQLGGDITVDSAPGKGAVFTARIPLTPKRCL
ncbi:two-component sensor histidine kinase [Pseudodesulfovibrio cashew]|uniref:histidine kinase n=1 Tax=Pseudodesulfovibrio cashew TaxID=2678688 RepID=A0A6I6JDS8_9BACT|nr:ATP-binding protein [Pseudodesulfovibrio cashew]QGY40301.1 two-component sensor histidine kinase [Pseudodesulfovibrio cashew]